MKQLNNTRSTFAVPQRFKFIFSLLNMGSYNTKTNNESRTINDDEYISETKDDDNDYIH